MLVANDDDEGIRSGAQLLAEWGCKTREQMLERACMALMATLNELHIEHKGQDLRDHEHYCGCADAFKMGATALGASPRVVLEQMENWDAN